MRLISAGSLVRAQSGPAFAWSVAESRRMPRRSRDEGGLLVLRQRSKATAWQATRHSRIPARLLQSDRSKLEINERYLTGSREQFKRQKRANVRGNLNARRLKRETVNKLYAFLRDRQK